MRDPKVNEISAEISTLQSKLGLLRNEFMRTKATISHEQVRSKLAKVEKELDELQSQYGRMTAFS
ncbi:hypothetical protein [Reichenbachiella sp.]|uniref:hypothetical protein n=1 Tax=Reichenbachiella sp. TaxID=2184521 RepID=UPI003B5C5D59